MMEDKDEGERGKEREMTEGKSGEKREGQAVKVQIGDEEWGKGKGEEVRME